MAMGYIKHHTIVVTGFQDESIMEAHQKAKEIFNKNFENDYYEDLIPSCVVSDIIQGLANGISSFFIAPDGSKEGWSTSNYANIARKEFLNWLHNSNNDCDYVEIVFGGDDGHEMIIRSKHIDLNANNN